MEHMEKAASDGGMGGPDAVPRTRPPSRSSLQSSVYNMWAYFLRCFMNMFYPDHVQR